MIDIINYNGDHQDEIIPYVGPGAFNDPDMVFIFAIPVGKIAEKAVCRSVFLTMWHCILSAELTKMHCFRLFFGDFVHWDNVILMHGNVFFEMILTS